MNFFRFCLLLFVAICLNLLDYRNNNLYAVGLEDFMDNKGTPLNSAGEYSEEIASLIKKMIKQAPCSTKTTDLKFNSFFTDSPKFEHAIGSLPRNESSPEDLASLIIYMKVWVSTLDLANTEISNEGLKLIKEGIGPTKWDDVSFKDARIRLREEFSREFYTFTWHLGRHQVYDQIWNRMDREISSDSCDMISAFLEEKTLTDLTRRLLTEYLDTKEITKRLSSLPFYQAFKDGELSKKAFRPAINYTAGVYNFASLVISQLPEFKDLHETFTELVSQLVSEEQAARVLKPINLPTRPDNHTSAMQARIIEMYLQDVNT